MASMVKIGKVGNPESSPSKCLRLAWCCGLCACKAIHGFESSSAGTWFHLLQDPCFLRKFSISCRTPRGTFQWMAIGKLPKVDKSGTKYCVWNVWNSETCSPKVKLLFMPFHLLLVQLSSCEPLFFKCSTSLVEPTNLWMFKDWSKFWPLATYEYHCIIYWAHSHISAP